MTTETSSAFLVYHHRGAPEALSNLLTWVDNISGHIVLTVRLDEDDEYLGDCTRVVEGADDLSFPLTCFVGPPDRDAIDVAGEMWSLDPFFAKHLCYVTDDPTSCATFLLSYFSESPRSRKGN